MAPTTHVTVSSRRWNIFMTFMLIAAVMWIIMIVRLTEISTSDLQRRFFRPFAKAKGVKLNRYQNLTPVPTIHLPGHIVRGTNYDDSVSRDQGVVICMHEEAVALGLSLIDELRCLGNDELILVYHCLDELSEGAIKLLLTFDNRIEVIDFCADAVDRREMTFDEAEGLQNWWLKPMAVHHANLTHVMLMDVDNIFLSNPSHLRSTSEYQSTGTLFFYDRIINGNVFMAERSAPHKPTKLERLMANFDYAKFGIHNMSPSDFYKNSWAWEGKSGTLQDSSLVLINKSKTGVALDVLWYLVMVQRHKTSFSHGDKEYFWCAYELAHQPYSFSPWGASGISSYPYEDTQKHPDSLCGSLAHYLPYKDDVNKTLLYVNGKAAIDPYPEGLRHLQRHKMNNWYNMEPTHMANRSVPRLPGHIKTKKDEDEELELEFLPMECLEGFGSTPVPTYFASRLLRRRVVYFGLMTGVTDAMGQCGDVLGE